MPIIRYENTIEVVEIGSSQPDDLLGLLQVTLAAVGVVADLCRELKSAIMPYCDEIMALLLENLSVIIIIF